MLHSLYGGSPFVASKHCSCPRWPGRSPASRSRTRAPLSSCPPGTSSRTTRSPTALAEAVAFHRSYWGESAAPRAQVALGLLAVASLAYDHGFPFALPQPYLPTYLLDRQRIEEIPG